MVDLEKKNDGEIADLVRGDAILKRLVAGRFAIGEAIDGVDIQTCEGRTFIEMFATIEKIYEDLRSIRNERAVAGSEHDSALEHSYDWVKERALGLITWLEELKNNADSVLSAKIDVQIARLTRDFSDNRDVM